jgi:hypothetical protein
MQRDRLWFGTALIAGPLVLLLLMMVPSVEGDQCGQLEGHVSIHGRPLEGGIITLVPEDARNPNWAAGFIDETGHFVLSSGWYHGALKDRMGFRICITPVDLRSTGYVPRGAGDSAYRAGASGSGVNVVADFPRQLSDPRTTRLEVRLDSEPAHVDIAL